MGIAEVFYFIRGVDRFKIDLVHFPTVTKAAVSVEEALRWGILPLGTKRRMRWFFFRQYLNVGAVRPSLKGLHPQIKQIAKRALGTEYGGYRLYRVSAANFFEVMSSVYGKSKEEVLREASPEVASQLNDHPQE